MPDRKEYIERGAMIARLKSSPLFQNFGEDGRFILAGVVELLEILPAADVVEVVRCSQCKHWHQGDCYRLELSRPDDYCSYGKRKDGAGNGNQQ